MATLSPKSLEVAELLGIDEGGTTAYFVAARGAHRSMHSALIAPPGNAATNAPDRADRATDKGEGSHAIVADGLLGARYFPLSKQFSVGTSSFTTMPLTRLITAEGKDVAALRSVAEVPKEMPLVTEESVGTDKVAVAIIRPKAYAARSAGDVGMPAPSIDSAYGGPSVALVSPDARAFLDEQWLANATGMTVVSIDARGTPGRGRAWSRAISGKLGDVPVDGHAEVIAELVKTHPELDGKHVGVTGWSFGGYFAAFALAHRPDVYSAGVAGAPPIDWRDYDSAYTERYLGIPDKDKAAYESASVLTKWQNAKARASNLLIIHGTADDNVYFFNSMKLVDLLERSGRAYEFLPLPGATHMVADPKQRERVMLRSATYLRERLLAPPPVTPVSASVESSSK